MLFLFVGNIFGQTNTMPAEVVDTIGVSATDTSAFVAIDLVDSVSFDSIYTDSIYTDSIYTDSISADTVETTPPEDFLEDKVDYTSTDSMSIAVDGQKLYLYKEAQVNYTDIELKADYIEFDMANQEVFAKGVLDSVGNPVGTPVFTQGDQTFASDSLRYNFKSGKGIIYQVTTEQPEGTLHSAKTKRTAEGHIHVAGGKYTTCDAPHPHFYLALSKAIVIPEDKIVAGPSYLVVLDIPVPLILPFGFFPNTSSRTSGVLIPTYGEESNRGFYLRKGGWYQVLGDYADYTIQADIYSKGSWAIYNDLSYKLRYKFSGSFGLDYAVTDVNDDPTYVKQNRFKVTWKHTQDTKANPTSKFSANVNFQNNKYDESNSYSSSDYLNTSKTSSINYSKNWPSSPFNLSLSALASQNSSTEKTNMTLPSGSFNMSRIYLFKWMNKSGTDKWYDDIGLSYSSSFSNKINTYDSLLFQNSTYEHTDFNFSHSIPLILNIKTGSVFNISPSLSYKGNIYNFSMSKHAEYDTAGNPTIVTDTTWEWNYAHAFYPSISFGFNPKIYGIYQNTRPDPKIVAIRHVITPSARFNYVPDMSMIFNNYPNYYDTLYYMEDGEIETDIYSIYKSPPSANGQSGKFTFSLANNLEGKRMVEGDTTGEGQKFTILESLNFSTSYNPFAEEDEKAWGDISMSTAFKFFKKKLSISSRGTFSMYGYDSTGSTTTTFIWDENGRYLRLNRLSTTASISFKSKQGGGGEGAGEGEGPGSGNENMQVVPSYYEDELYLDPEFSPGAYYGGTYVDFNAPWSFSTSYSWIYSLANPYKLKRTQTLKVSGDISLTSKWKIGGSTNYDIEDREFSFTNISVHRDLHCWEMNFTMVPFGARRSYSFTIRAKADMLQDLKIDKEQSWYDNF